MGCDHIYLLSDRAFAGADTLATTYTLAQAIHKLGGADLVFCGEESSDGATGQVPSGLAEWLGIAQLTLLIEIDADTEHGLARGRREIKGGYEILEVPLPCVVSVKTAANEPRFMDSHQGLGIRTASGRQARPGYNLVSRRPGRRPAVHRVERVSDLGERAGPGALPRPQTHLHRGIQRRDRSPAGQVDPGQSLGIQ